MDLKEAKSVWLAYEENLEHISDGEEIDYITVVNNIWIYKTVPVKHLCVVMTHQTEGVRHLRLAVLSEELITKYSEGINNIMWIHALG